MNSRIIVLLFPVLLIGFSCKPPGELPTDPNKGRFYTYAGFPAVTDYPNSLTVLYNEGYVAGYDEVQGVPAWVAYRVEKVEEYTTSDRRSRFLIDDRTESRISHDHYTNTGYDRGHMAPNFAIVTRYGEEAQRETFLMTNIIPQTPQLNRQWWAQLERLVARDYSETFEEVWVITGPVYHEDENWIKGEVRIPTHNFKILKVEVEDELRMKAFLVPQTIEGDEPLEPYLVSVNRIEQLTGLDFNPALDPELADSLESMRITQLWEID